VNAVGIVYSSKPSRFACLTAKEASPYEQCITRHAICLCSRPLPEVRPLESCSSKQWPGKAIVNTMLDGTGVPFVSRNGESGLTVAPADVDALAAAVTRLLSDDTLRKRLGAAGRMRVRQEFTSQRMADLTLSTYRQVIANQSLDKSG
jgi:glycosyl transferase family 1